MKNDKIEEIVDELWELLPADFNYKNVDRKSMYNWLKSRLENTLHQQKEEIWREAEGVVKSLVEEIGCVGVFLATSPTETKSWCCPRHYGQNDTLANMKSAQTLHDNNKEI